MSPRYEESNNFQHSFPTFSSQRNSFRKNVLRARFLESDLGRIYLAVPWDGTGKILWAWEFQKGPEVQSSHPGHCPDVPEKATTAVVRRRLYGTAQRGT